MKFKDIPIGGTFTKSDSIFMKIQEVVPKLEINRVTSDRYPIRFNTVIIGGINGTNGILIWFNEEDEFN